MCYKYFIADMSAKLSKDDKEDHKQFTDTSGESLNCLIYVATSLFLASLKVLLLMHPLLSHQVNKEDEQNSQHNWYKVAELMVI